MSANIFTSLEEKTTKLSAHLACEQALQGVLEGGQEKEGEPATTSLQFEFHFQYYFPVAPHQLSCQISANQHEVETSANDNKH